MPVVAYDIYPFGGARSHFPSAEILFPRPTFGSNYIVLATPKGTSSPSGQESMFGQIIAVEDGTTVTVRPSVNLPAAAGIPAIAKGATGSLTLDAGQFVQWELPADSQDLSGTVVGSDKPVAVVAGDRLFELKPLGEGPGGESTHQQVRPVEAWSSRYVVAPFETRRKDLAEETIYYRVVGAVDGTTLTYDPPQSQAPASLKSSGVADFTAVGGFIIHSQDSDHPFAIAQIMPSANVPGGSRPGAVTDAAMFGGALGDEDFLLLLPPEQFRSKYVFFTDYTYATTNLVVTRQKGPGGFADVTVDCLGPLDQWKPLGGSGEFEYTTVDLLRANVPTNSCTNGRQSASSSGHFGLSVFGLDTYSSYSYPAGGSAAKLSSVVIKP
jgi:hypothetical protein